MEGRLVFIREAYREAKGKTIYFTARRDNHCRVRRTPLTYAPTQTTLDPFMEPTPIQPKQKSRALRIFMTICGVIVLLGGMAQVWKGVGRLNGGANPQFMKLLEESDTAVAEARRHAAEATPLFTQMLNDVDRLGLETFRSQQKEAVAKTRASLAGTIDQFRLGEKRIEEAKGLNKNEKMLPWLTALGRSYGMFAQRVEINQEIVQLINDESITSVDTLVPKINEAAARGAEIEKNAKAASAEATELGEKIKADSKK